MRGRRQICLPLAVSASKTVRTLFQRFVTANGLLLLLQSYLHLRGQAVKQAAAAGIVAQQSLQCWVGIHFIITSVIRLPARRKRYAAKRKQERSGSGLPQVQYCKKCRREVPLAGQCTYCGSRLGKNSETLSFDVIHVPLKDWFSWNAWLRVLLPSLVLLVAAVVAAEFAAGGLTATLVLLRGNFLPIMLVLLCAMLLVGLLLLWLQRGERIHYAIDKLGLHAWTYLEDPQPVQLFARFLTPDMVRQLEDDERTMLDMTLIRHQFIAWKDVARTHFWKENCVLLLYSPRWWQTMAVHCPLDEMAAVEQMLVANTKRTVRNGRRPATQNKKRI